MKVALIGQMGSIAKILVKAGYGERIMKIVEELAEDKQNKEVKESLAAHIGIIASVLGEAYGKRIIEIGRKLLRGKGEIRKKAQESLLRYKEKINPYIYARIMYGTEEDIVEALEGCV